MPLLKLSNRITKLLQWTSLQKLTKATKDPLRRMTETLQTMKMYKFQTLMMTSHLAKKLMPVFLATLSKRFSTNIFVGYGRR